MRTSILAGLKTGAAASILALSMVAASATAQVIPDDPTLFQMMDVFDLEYAAEPQMSPDGRTIVYVRHSFDVRTDQERSNLWTVDVESGAHRPLLSGTQNFSSPRWSPDGKRLAYVNAGDEGAQIYVRWMKDGQTARITDLLESPSGVAWSPDGSQIAFTMFQDKEAAPIAVLPTAPEGTEWNARPKVIDQTFYRGDGAGYYEQGLSQLFVISAEGGSPKQITRDDYEYRGAPSWSGDGQTLYVSSDRTENWREGQGQNDLFAVDVRTGGVRPVTSTPVSEYAPALSPAGERIAYAVRSDRKSWHVPTEVWTSRPDGSDAQRVAAGLDRSIGAFEWDPDGRALYLSYDDGGTTKLARAPLGGGYDVIADGLGGESLGRPYSGASFSVADDDGAVAFNIASDNAPAELAMLRGGDVRQLTHINDDLKSMNRFGDVRELTSTAADGTQMQSWLITPPGFDPSKKYPMILEIHGGPHANYGRRFTAELQLYAAAGYVVLYGNPRGSTGYGDDFAMGIDRVYPGPDYDDLMAAVDNAVGLGFVDPEKLYVTGGSGGGVLTSWIVGKTDRFRAAVVAKPVINWTSFVLLSDFGVGQWDELFGKKPWEDQASYWARSPLSLVGNVKTPTMLMTGEEDYRTPISETEQYYGALKIQGVDTAMVRIQGSGHSITARPSNLMAKVAYILGWFRKYDKAETAPQVAGAVSGQAAAN